jgi:hypothetical protein
VDDKGLHEVPWCVIPSGARDGVLLICFNAA